MAVDNSNRQNIALGRFQFELRHHNGNKDRLRLYMEILERAGVDIIAPITGAALQEYYHECRRENIEPEL